MKCACRRNTPRADASPRRERDDSETLVRCRGECPQLRVCRTGVRTILRRSRRASEVLPAISLSHRPARRLVFSLASLKVVRHPVNDNRRPVRKRESPIGRSNFGATRRSPESRSGLTSSPSNRWSSSSNQPPPAPQSSWTDC